jgi:hypothetical protein
MRTVKVLLCAEGPHDMGLSEWCDRSRAYRTVEGWMQPVIRKLVTGDCELVFRCRRRTDLIRQPGDRSRAPKGGHAEKAFYAMRIAKTEGADMLVFMVDNDRGKRDRQRWQTICQDIWRGFDAAGNPVPAAACIPVSASESWLLADADAWMACGLPETHAAMLPGDPEAIWGQRDDPRSQHPHHYFDAVCAAAGHIKGVHGRNILAERLGIDAVKGKCPISFKPFADAVASCLAVAGCRPDHDFAALSPGSANRCPA